MDTAWPSGVPVVTLRLERVYHVERPDGSLTNEPAGFLTRRVCLVCGDHLWRLTREQLDRNYGR
jgi:hypothetical protein